MGKLYNEKSIEDMEQILVSYSILAHMGFKCVTEDGKDITEDLKKVMRIELE